MRSLFAIIRGIVAILTMVIFLLGYAFSCLFKKHTMQRAFRLRERWVRYMAIPIFGMKIEKSGDTYDKPAIYVSNHRSFADPVAICRYVRAAVVAKAEVAQYPIINKGAEVTGVVWVDRQDKDSRAAVRETIAKTVKDGHNVLIFPEGTISTRRHTLPIRPGSFATALAHDIPVIPIAIDFQHPTDMWTIPNVIKQYIHQFWKWRTYVKIRIGTPIPRGTVEEMVAYTEQWMADQLDEIQENWTKVTFDD